MGDVPMSPTNYPPPQGSWALAAPDDLCVQDQDLSQPLHAALQLINGLRAATAGNRCLRAGSGPTWALDKGCPVS